MPQLGASKPPPGAFFDTDFSTIDSVLAVALLHGLQGKGECRVALVSMSRPNLAVAGFADAMERFYRGPAGNFAQLPPIGMRTVGSPGETSPAFTAPFLKKKPDGTPVYRNDVKTVIQTGDPNTLYRNYLQAHHDQNAFFVLAGPATNLAAALDFRGLKELLVAKVRYLVVASNALQADPPAAKKLMAEWPTPIVTAGPEIGAALEFPGASIDNDFAAASPDNPVADAYRAYKPMPYDAPSWAMAAALYAARPKEGYFKVTGPDRRQQLSFDPEQRDRIIQAYVELASAKPAQRRFRPQ